MKRPRAQNTPPRGDWVYTQPETNMPFRASHWRTLEDKVFEHRMSLPDLKMDVTGGWRERLWDAICKANPYLDCEDTEDKGRWPNLADAVNWIRSMAHWREMGFATVPQEEANRRAEICKACPHNRNIGACYGCRGVGDIVSELTGGKSTPHDSQLDMCDVCLCVIRAKVHLPRQVIHTDGLDDKFPSFCWLKNPTT